jgi:putative heme-binding domain-containing protein
MSQLGPAVPSGLTRYSGGAFGTEYRDNFFAAMFNLRKVTRNVLAPSGATFTNRESDFLVSGDRDFHPTDVIEDADGSLLVVDTGPWYKLCCPTSQLAKPDVRGAIYRVRRKGAAAVSDPRGTQLAWATLPIPELVALLDDRRAAVRARAIDQLGARGAVAVPEIAARQRPSSPVAVRLNAVWALTRIDGEAARAAVRTALGDADPIVRQAAAHSAGLWRDAGARASLVRALTSGDPALARVGAEALGRLGDSAAVRDLVETAARADRVLAHSLTYALIEIANPASTLAAGRQAGSAASRRAALIAVDQMPGGTLTAADILPLLESTDAGLRDTGWWIAGRHPAWGGTLAPLFHRRLAAAASATERTDLETRLAQFAIDPSIQPLIASAATDASPAVRLSVLSAMAIAAKATPKLVPPSWIPVLERAVRGTDVEIAGKAVSVLRAAPAAAANAPALGDALLVVAKDPARTIDARLDALSVLPRDAVAATPELFDLLRTSQGPAQPALVRSLGAGIVERSALSRPQLTELTRWIATAGPLELPRLLRAFDADGDETLGLALVAALEGASSRASLRPDVLKPRLAKYPASVQSRADALLATVNLDAGAQARRLAELETGATGGDVRRGQLVFNSEKTGCLTCHAIGYIGGKVGPDLTRIGQVRTERDLLEAVVYPNASFVRSYESVMVVLKSGAVRAGMLKSEDRGEVVLATGPADEVRVPRTDIADMRPSPVSIMPAGYGEQLTRQELIDLVAFLRAAR